jgi:hypothetical protein
VGGFQGGIRHRLKIIATIILFAEDFSYPFEDSCPPLPKVALFGLSCVR